MDDAPFTGKFFEPSEGYGHAPNECDQIGLMHFDAYAENYYKSADELCRSAEDNRGLTNTFGHPIAFLYRQYIELRLKDVVALLRRLETRKSGYPPVHSLKTLWTEAAQLLNQHYSREQMPEGIEYVEQCVNEFDVIDSDSTLFRYPIARRGGVFNPPRFDLVRLRIGMSVVEDFLGTVRSDLEFKWQNSPD